MLYFVFDPREADGWFRVTYTRWGAKHLARRLHADWLPIDEFYAESARAVAGVR